MNPKPAHPRGSGDPGVFDSATTHRPDPEDSSSPEAGAVPDEACVPVRAEMSGEEGSQKFESAGSAGEPPWTALIRRPEVELTGPERSVRRRVIDHRLPLLYGRDRPEALRRWSGWVRRFDIDPDRSPTPPRPCVSDPPHLNPGPRAALL